jgi:hypothetical protein
MPKRQDGLRAESQHRWSHLHPCEPLLIEALLQFCGGSTGGRRQSLKAPCLPSWTQTEWEWSRKGSPQRPCYLCFWIRWLARTRQETWGGCTRPGDPHHGGWRSWQSNLHELISSEDRCHISMFIVHDRVFYLLRSLLMLSLNQSTRPKNLTRQIHSSLFLTRPFDSSLFFDSSFWLVPFFDSSFWLVPFFDSSFWLVPFFWLVLLTRPFFWLVLLTRPFFLLVLLTRPFVVPTRPFKVWLVLSTRHSRCECHNAP